MILRIPIPVDSTIAKSALKMQMNTFNCQMCAATSFSSRCWRRPIVAAAAAALLLLHAETLLLLASLRLSSDPVPWPLLLLQPLLLALLLAWPWSGKWCRWLRRGRVEPEGRRGCCCCWTRRMLPCWCWMYASRNKNMRLVGHQGPIILCADHLWTQRWKVCKTRTERRKWFWGQPDSLNDTKALSSNWRKEGSQ